MGVNVGENELTLELTAGLPATMLDERICFHNRGEESHRRALAFYLLDLYERRAWTDLSCPNIEFYAKHRLEMSRSVVYDLIRVAGALKEYQEISEAFDHGKICWSKVRAITRVVKPSTEAKWVAFAKRYPSEVVAEAVKRAKKAEDSKGSGLGTPTPYSTLKIDLPTVDHKLFQAAVARRMEESGDGATPAAAIKEMVEADLARDPKDGKRPRVAIVYHVGPDGNAWIDGEDGPLPIAREVVEKEAAGAKVYKVKDVEDPGDLEAIRLGERGSVPAEDRDPEVSEAMRMVVLMRDGFRCVICGGKKKLRAHHLQSRANGGKTREEYLITCCLTCHSLLHGGLMNLRWDKERGLIPLDCDHNPIRKEGGMAAALKDSKLPLTVIAVQPAAEEDAEVEVTETEERALPPIRSIEDVPARLSPAGTHALSSVLDWNAAQRLFVIRPDRAFFPGAPEPSPDEEAEAETTDASVGFSRVVGQSTVVANLSEAVQAARIRGVPLDHVLLEGPPGLGKTTLAQVLAVEMGSRLHAITAPSIEHPHHLVMLLAGLSEGDVFFIDEIHRLDRRCEECLYSALEYGYIDLLVGGEGRRRTIRAFLNPFTLVGATTQLGSLAKPFRDRFTMREELTFYTVDELVTVVEQEARRLGSPVSHDAAQAIACRARGTPREALQLLKRVRNLAVIDGGSAIEVHHVQLLADRIGIDENGLWPRDQAILELLIARDRPMGLTTIALTLGLDSITLEQVCEPYLVHQRYVIRTPRGRRATAKAYGRYGPGQDPGLNRSPRNFSSGEDSPELFLR